MLIVTAVKDEWDAVLAVDTAATLGTSWDVLGGTAGLEVRYRDFVVEGGELRIAVVQALGMGREQAVIAAAPLLARHPEIRCLAMCGVCAGRRDDVALGDVIIADRAWPYDAGKLKAIVDADGARTERFQGDVELYRIHPPEWKQRAERFRVDPLATWIDSRPRSYEAQGDWILERLKKGDDPWAHADRANRCPDWEPVLKQLWKTKRLEDGELKLSEIGNKHISRRLTLAPGGLGDAAPFKVVVGPIASGAPVVEDPTIFERLSDTQAMRKVIGLEMETSAILALAYASRVPHAVVMKGVMDHADSFKSDNMKSFAALASAECMIAFLRQNLPLVSAAGRRVSSPPIEAPTAAASLIASEPSIPNAAHPVDIGILTIRADEFSSVLGAFPDRVRQFRAARTGRAYSLRRADAGNGAHYTLAVLRQNEQGNGEAQNAARDLIEDFSPSLILVVGIAGGVPSADVTLGDVVLSTRILDFTVEAQTVDEAPTYSTTGGPVPKGLASLISNLAAHESELGDWTTGLPPLPLVSWTAQDLSGPADWQNLVRSKLERHYGGRSPRAPVYVDGPIASSDRLITDPAVLIPWLQTARKLLAVEMESGGVYRAAQDRCPMVAIRGISDIVGLKRDDEWAHFACDSAAAFAKAFLRTTPVPPRSATAHPISESIAAAAAVPSQGVASPERAPATLEAFIKRETARDIVGFGWNLPIIGRDAGVAEVIASFKSNECRLMPVAGPGGIGKTRFLAEVARQALASGAIDTAHYVSSTSELQDICLALPQPGKSLLIVDELLDAAMVRQLADKLSEPECHCIALIGIRSADRSLIEAVTRGTRNRFIAPLYQLQSLSSSDASELAKKALEYTDGEAPEQAVAWIVRMSQGVPVWLMLAAKLINEGADVRDLPKDRWRLAARYIDEALPSEQNDRLRLLQALRWLALLHPYSREAQPLVTFMCDRLSLTIEQLDAAIEELGQRRLVIAYGINNRRAEVRPAILRDSIIVSWLSPKNDSSVFAVSTEGRSLIEIIARDHSSIDRTVLQRMLAGLGRINAIVDQKLPVLNLLGDAVERTAASAKDAKEQLNALSLAEMTAPAVLSPLLYAAKTLRTTVVPDYIEETPWGPHVTKRTEVIRSIPWALFVACWHARTRDECQQLVDELVALLPMENSRQNGGAASAGKSPEALIPRLLSEQFSPEFRNVLLDAARHYVRELRKPVAIPPTLATALTVLSLEVVVQYSRSEADKFTWGHYVIDPRSAVGQEISKVAGELLEGIRYSSLEVNALVLWSILDKYHQGLRRATVEWKGLWRDQLLSCLRECHNILVSPTRTISGREWFAARKIWHWHARHDPDDALREVAHACEELFRSRPELGPHLEWLFDDISHKEHQLAIDSLVDRLLGDSSIDLRRFFESALTLADESAEEGKVRKVQYLATRLGERAELTAHVSAFVKGVPKERNPLFECAASIVAAQLGVVRRTQSSEKLREMLNEWSAVLTPRLFIEEVYLNGSVLVQANLTLPDWECLMQHLHLFSGDARWRLLGLAFAAEGERSRDLIDREVDACTGQMLSELLFSFWAGFHSRFIVTENAEHSAFTTEQLEWFLSILARVPDVTIFHGSFIDDLETIGSHHPKHSASWLCNLIRHRREEFVKAGSADPNGFWPVSHDQLFLSFASFAKIDDKDAIAALIDYGYSQELVPYGLMELLTELDPDGLVIPQLVAAKLTSLQATAETLSEIATWAEFASEYPVGMPAWRLIAEAACTLVSGLPRGDREQVYWKLFRHRGGVWSAPPGEVASKWTSAVAAAEEILKQEPAGCLRSVFQWHLEQVRDDLERERQLAQEQAVSLRGL